jgi:hypothetical protein
MLTSDYCHKLSTLISPNTFSDKDDGSRLLQDITACKKKKMMNNNKKKKEEEDE